MGLGIRRAIRDFGIGIVGVVTLGGGFRPREEFVGVRCRERAACGVALVGGGGVGIVVARGAAVVAAVDAHFVGFGPGDGERPVVVGFDLGAGRRRSACGEEHRLLFAGERFARHGVVLTARRQEQRRSDDRKGYAVRHGLVVLLVPLSGLRRRDAAFVLDNPHRDLSDDLLAAVDVGVGRHEGDFIVARFGVGVGVAAQRSLGHRLDADAEVGTVVDLVHPVDGSADGPAFAGDRGLELAAEKDARGVDVGQRSGSFERGRLHELPMYVGEIVERGDRLSGYAVELRRLDVPLRAAVLYRGVVGFDYPVETEIERGFRVGEVFGDTHVARQQSLLTLNLFWMLLFPKTL